MIETLREGKALDTYVGSCECGAFYRVPLEDIEGPLDEHGNPENPRLSCPTPRCGRVVFLKREDSDWAIAGEDARMFRVHTLGMTMGAAARRVGWSVAQVSEAETGRVDPAALGQLYKALSRVIG